MLNSNSGNAADDEGSATDRAESVSDWRAKDASWHANLRAKEAAAQNCAGSQTSVQVADGRPPPPSAPPVLHKDAARRSTPGTTTWKVRTSEKL